MKKNLFCLLFITLISACGGTKYSNSSNSLGVTKTETLINDAVKIKKRLGSVFSSADDENQYNLIFGELKSRHPEWDWERIDNSRVEKGMTEKEVLLAWGFPDSKSKSVSWKYFRVDKSKAIVNFEDSRVNKVIVINSFN
ncbi:hypothetical protein [Aliikangiella sp. G2MR2-5]|uniref:hypothetical protein n=1 Tax=Aliikangiella sp. G2MR2-5 TaxID=2788943 RepID=UPI0018AC06C5|nr:hypothetical protein [Aliikangiella sp. G2MR2-5]